jgi:CRP/FNR family transcriptional regulator, cyclic AMP receptor protein
MTETFLQQIELHPFLRGFPHQFVKQLEGCGFPSHFDAGQPIFDEGDPADRFFLLRDGVVALETAVPGRGLVVIDSLGGGQVLGWSWLVPPYRWHFGARAVERCQTVAFTASSVLELCAGDPAFGYELMRRFATVMVDRLQTTRRRMLDLYGEAARA